MNAREVIEDRVEIGFVTASCSAAAEECVRSAVSGGRLGLRYGVCW